MRNVLRIVGYGLLSIFSADLFVAIADWSARMEWVKSVLDRNPHTARFVRSPLFMGLLLLLGFGFLWAERKIKLPRIRARFMNCKLVPRLRTMTPQAVFDAEEEKPGWDKHQGTWDWFVDVLLTNESDTPTTIEEVDVRLQKIRKFWGVRLPSWLPCRKTYPCRLVQGVDDHWIHKSVLDIYDQADSEIPSLLAAIKNIPITIGIDIEVGCILFLPMLRNTI